MSGSPADNMSPDAALKASRLVWGGALLSVLAVAGVLLAVRGVEPTPARPAMLGPVRVAFVVLAALILATPVGYFIRLQTYKRGWQGFKVGPTAYVRGNVVLFAVLQGVALLSLVLGAFFGDQAPCWAVALIALLALVINFPSGRPMESTPPRL